MSRLSVVGLYVAVGGGMPPVAVLLAAGTVRLFEDRERVVGRDKALQATFGQLCEYAFPANDGALTYLMEHAVSDALPYGDELAALAAKIILGKPLGDGKDLTEGGLKVRANPLPVKPRPGGIAKRVQELADPAYTPH